MLIPLFLYKKGVLSSPDFYMSGYLEAHCKIYHKRLRAVSRDGAWTAWCIFFLEGIIQQSAENEQKARAILALYEQVKNRVVDLTISSKPTRLKFQTCSYSTRRW
ncbi:hypothetical protein SAMN05428952_10183 [Nitrosomonas sp. Nm132]|nr:hypothetical protein SAMN05428952_10183 [Nitrosomonas sp. Nm132]